LRAGADLLPEVGAGRLMGIERRQISVNGSDAARFVRCSGYGLSCRTGHEEEPMSSFRSALSILAFAIALCLVRQASGAVTVTPVPCGLRLDFDPVSIAAHYRVSRVYNGCQNTIRRAEFIAEVATNEYLLLSNPAFVGNFRVEAIGPQGGVLSIQESDIGTPTSPATQPAVGAPWIPTGSFILSTWVGERIELVQNDVPAGVSLQWTRNGVPIPGATGPQLTWITRADDEGAVLAPTTSNSCGTHVGLSRILALAPSAPPSGAISWVGIRRAITSTGSTCIPLCGTGCCVASTTVLQTGWPATACVQPLADGFTASCSVGTPSTSNTSNSGASQLRFLVPLPSVITLSGTNAVTSSNGGFVICGSVFGSVAGPVNATLPSAVGPWGPVQVTLPRGEYRVEIGSSASSGCPSGSQSSCTGTSVMNITASVAPLPYLVPLTYPTIQAGIDAAPPGEARVLTVAPGVYRESFSLNGKNVLVLGAPGHGTILDGTGLATSIVRFTGGEPATAGLENLVIRNGTRGSLLYPGAPFEVGSAVFGAGTAASIRSCIFENCAAGYGGAIYQIGSTVGIHGCGFEGNRASAEGGAVFLYESSGMVSDCAFIANECGSGVPGAGSAFKGVGARTAGGTLTLSGCGFSANRGLISGSAIEYYENAESLPGTLQIVACSVTGNLSGVKAPSGAAGLRVLGTEQSCILSGGTEICSNSPRNVAGSYRIKGSATVCACAADIDGDGTVGSPDITAVLAGWGSSGGGAADIDGDGSIGAQDLAALLAAWGDCP